MQHLSRWHWFNFHKTTDLVVGREAAAQAAVLLILLHADQLEVVSLCYILRQHFDT